MDADMFGWEEMAASVARVYQALPDDEKRRAIIFAQNYGEAGAVEYYGRRYGLPRAISGHNSFFLWGPGDLPRDLVLIVIGGNPKDAEAAFGQVGKAGVIAHEYAMPYESGLPIWVCRNPRVNLAELWPKLKRYD
ncbi:MAG: hypothetical protein M1436_01480 [Acidobacteria bacterium]|nr:hypothetical protein [Acidobacteriota bacterium]